MPRAAVNAKPVEPQCESPAQVLAAYQAHHARTGRGNTAFTYWAKTFLRRWPVVRDWEHEPLKVQLSANSGTRPFIMFLLVTGRLHPGWEYLVHRKFSSIWRDVPGTIIGQDLDTFIAAARGCGYSQRVASAMASQVIARVLFATGPRLGDLGHDDFEALAVAGAARQAATGRTWKHYRATAAARQDRAVSPRRAARAAPSRSSSAGRSPGASRTCPEPLRAHPGALPAAARRSPAVPPPCPRWPPGWPRFGTLPRRHRPARDPRDGWTGAAHIEPCLTSACHRGEHQVRRDPVRPRSRPAGSMAVGELPDRDHRMGLARGTHPAAAVPLRQPAPAPTPATVSAHRTPTDA